MTSLQRGAIGVALAVATVLVPLRAHAFCRTTTAPVPANYDAARNGCITSGLALYWKGACVTYAINQDAASYIPFETATKIIDQAFATWATAKCADTGERAGISLYDLGAVECAEVRYNSGSPNQNLIVFRETSWPYNDAANTLGLTTVTFNADNGEIYDADMEINASEHNLSISDQVPQNGFDLLSVITHEAGHFLGLAHATSPTATMFASYRPGTINLRSLTPDDVAGLCAMYPNDKERVVDPKVSASGVVAADACSQTPRHGFTTKCEEASGDDKGCAVAPASSSPERRGLASLAGLAVVAGAAGAIRRRRSRVM